MITYKEVANAKVNVEAKDAVYSVRFDKEYNAKHTGRIRVRFEPDEDSMVYPEDGYRQRTFVMENVQARALWKLLKNRAPEYWYAVDMAFQGKFGKLVLC